MHIPLVIFLSKLYGQWFFNHRKGESNPCFQSSDMQQFMNNKCKET